MADITIQKITRTGVIPSFTAAAATDHIAGNDGGTFLYVKNGGVSTDNVAVVATYASPPAGTALANLAVAVAAGAEKMIGPFPKASFNDSNGKVQVTHSFLTSVTQAALSLL